MNSFVIDRSKWLRGEGEHSRLFRSDDNKMCCLGFAGLALGYTTVDMWNIGAPGEMAFDHSQMQDEAARICKWPNWIVQTGRGVDDDAWFANTDVTDALVTINDDTETADAYKEENISSIFESYGVTVTFI